MVDVHIQAFPDNRPWMSSKMSAHQTQNYHKQAGFTVIRKGKTVDVLDLKNQSLALLARILPRGSTTKAMKLWMGNGLEKTIIESC